MKLHSYLFCICSEQYGREHIYELDVLRTNENVRTNFIKKYEGCD